jgi:membrane protease YdiL (CAAX protease family)
VQSLVKPPPPEYLELFRRLHQALAPTGLLDGVLSLIVIAALPALCEELVVRGLVLPSFVRPLGSLAAVAATALLFALMHLDPYRFVFTFVLGLVFGALRLRTGSLWPSVLAHLTLNGLTFLVAPYVDDGSAAYTPQPALGFACLTAGCALAFPLLRALRRPAA